MSNALAVATVTTALARIVRQAAASAVPGADVVTGRPDPAAPGAAAHHVHLYLYQVSANGALRNADLPTRSGAGRTVQRPQAAIDLHYLLTFYGDDKTLEPQRMLGAVVRDLHARPVLTQQAITDAIVGDPTLVNSDLADQVERVKITPLALALEELSKLWSVFFQTPHGLSVAYQACVVLIHSEEPYQPVLPVLTRGPNDRGVDLVLGPFPTLERYHAGLQGDVDLHPRPPPFPSGRLGLWLLFGGRNLSGESPRLRFANPRLGIEQELVPTAVGTELLLELPDDAAARTAWAAGVYTSTAVFGTGGLDRTSNALPLAIAPRIESIAPPNPVPRDGAGMATLTIDCVPDVRLEQQAVLLLAGHEVKAEPRASPADPLVFQVTNAPVVTDALVRVRVDGVESMPVVRTDPPPPPGLAFDDAQRVTIV